MPEKLMTPPDAELDELDIAGTALDELSTDPTAAACARVAPVWPLDRFVAVNPYLGLCDLTPAAAFHRLGLVTGAAGTMPLGFYLAAVDEGRILPTDLRAALDRLGEGAPDTERFLRRARQLGQRAAPAPRLVPTVADVVAQVSGRDWAAVCVDRVSSFAASYFDEGQAIWRATAHEGLYATWKREAEIDRTPEVLGLRGFRAAVQQYPADPSAAQLVALTRLAVPDDLRELYLHRLLMRVGGWAAHAARAGFEAGLDGREDDTLAQLLSVLVVWEAAMLDCSAPEVADRWRHDVDRFVADDPDPEVLEHLQARVVLQDAFDRGAQRRLVHLLDHDVPGDRRATGDVGGVAPVRPAWQAAFCIDVRSEVLRRHLEATDASVETIGFAGFFGFPVSYVPLAHADGRAQCPVLLRPKAVVAEVVPDPAADASARSRRRLAHQLRRAWKSFKSGAVTCFGFVSPMGVSYLPKLFTDAAGVTRPVPDPDREGLKKAAASAKVPSLDPTEEHPEAGLDLAQQLDTAEAALRGMSLRDRLAPLVVLVGHGASTTNNPYQASLACGACGGQAGWANSRVAAAVLNRTDVRAGLADRGIAIPDDTWFVAGYHDTTTDTVTLLDVDRVPASHAAALDAVRSALREATQRTRRERATRLPHGDLRDVEADVRRRASDWSEVRPEWGLAGCQAFVAAPRRRTRDLDLEGRCFLHSYDWRADEGFAVLELILTAPVVVASWINLQYYASTVDPATFGAGNKTLHNVVGRIGVVEGTSGDLRVGLPWQSVHDGERYQHEPVRLSVVVEAPLDAIGSVLASHPDVKQLFDNGWIHLLAMDDTGAVTRRYAGDLTWEPVSSS